jgi:NADH-quinone oxidoreductase subunit A
MGMPGSVIPVFLFVVCAAGLAAVLLVSPRLLNPSRPNRVQCMPYESGMDPIHDTHRRFDVRFSLLAIAFLVFDVELLFLYPWAAAALPATVESPQAGVIAARGLDAAVANHWLESRHLAFAGAMAFLILLAIGLVYDWRKGVFRWR